VFETEEFAEFFEGGEHGTILSWGRRGIRDADGRGDSFFKYEGSRRVSKDGIQGAGLFSEANCRSHNGNDEGV
jgi:hypothetical protein